MFSLLSTSFRREAGHTVNYCDQSTIPKIIAGFASHQHRLWVFRPSSWFFHDGVNVTCFQDARVDLEVHIYGLSSSQCNGKVVLGYFAQPPDAALNVQRFLRSYLNVKLKSSSVPNVGCYFDIMYRKFLSSMPRDRDRKRQSAIQTIRGSTTFGPGRNYI